MIKIDTNNFNWDIIYNIYRDTVIWPLCVRINNKYIVAKTHPVIKTLLAQWFFDNGQVSEAKVFDYLLQEELAKKLQQFDNAISLILQPADRAFVSVISLWPVAKQTALKLKAAGERKTTITTVITPKNVHLFTGITHNDLISPLQRGTVFCNKTKVSKIDLRCQSEISAIRKDLSEIFDYETFAPKFRDKLLAAMHIEVCPYCNRQYITNFKTSGATRSTADIDHFYNKTQYPFLALSLFNFVPSCHICNSRFKLTADFGHKKHINPYQRGFDKDGVFRLKNIDCLLEELVQGKAIQFEIENPNKMEEIENSIATFHLREIYESHQDYVGELIKKAKIYSNTQLEEYLENFRDLFESKAELQRIIFSNYLNDHELGKRPLAKLTKDLLDDLGIWND